MDWDGIGMGLGWDRVLMDGIWMLFKRCNKKKMQKKFQESLIIFVGRKAKQSVTTSLRRPSLIKDALHFFLCAKIIHFLFSFDEPWG